MHRPKERIKPNPNTQTSNNTTYSSNTVITKHHPHHPASSTWLHPGLYRQPEQHQTYSIITSVVANNHHQTKPTSSCIYFHPSIITCAGNILTLALVYTRILAVLCIRNPVCIHAEPSWTSMSRMWLSLVWLMTVQYCCYCWIGALCLSALSLQPYDFVWDSSSSSLIPFVSSFLFHIDVVPLGFSLSFSFVTFVFAVFITLIFLCIS